MAKATRPILESLRVVRTVDTNPDTSWIGKYHDDVHDKWSILRVGEYAGRYLADLRCDHDPEEAEPACPGCDSEAVPPRGREYRCFRPYAGGEPAGTDDYRTYGLQDYARMESLERQEWCFVGIYARARVTLPSGTVQTIRSAGLWGIESDSGDDYFDEVGAEECAQLAGDLESLGLSPRAVRAAIKAALAAGIVED